MIVLLIVCFALCSLSLWGAATARRLLRESLAAERRAQGFLDAADARSDENLRKLRAHAGENLRMLAAVREHAQALERYEFGTALRASAILRERERAS